MTRFLVALFLSVLVGFVVVFAPRAHAADYYQWTIATTSDGGGSAFVDAGCGVQYSVRCSDGGVRYRSCDLYTEPTCTATGQDMELMQDRTYDIRIPSNGSDNANCRMAFKPVGDVDGGTGVCRLYLVRPATLPSEMP